MPSDRHSLFIALCRAAGSRLDPILRQQVVTTDRVADVVAALEREKFSVAVHPDVATSIGGLRDEAQAIAAAALARTDAVWRGRPLRGYQRIGAAWLAPKRKAMLTDEPGVGKTPTCVAALPPEVPCVVICPKVAIPTWQRHVEWRTDFTPRTFKGRKSFAWPMPGFVHIFNFDILPDVELINTVLKETCPDNLHAIVDEAHMAKNLERKRSQRTKAILDLAFVRWIVTGTPLKNQPPDLWSMIVLADLEEETFRTEDAFRKAFGEGEGDDGETWDATGVASHVPQVLSRVMLRREKADVLNELPPKQVEEITVEIPDDAKRIADEAVEALAAVGVDVNQAIDMASLTKKGVVPFELLSRARSALAAAKMDALLELVESLESQQRVQPPDSCDPPTGVAGLAGDRRLRALERAAAQGDPSAQAHYAVEMSRRDGDLCRAVANGARWADPFLVWCCHRAPIDALSQRPGWTSITGSVNDPNKRMSIETDFQAGLYRGMALTVAAGGVSITLTRAWRAIFVDLPWTPADLQQAEDRIHRLGQTNPCLYTYLVADHQLDRWLVGLLGRKKEIEAASVRAAAVKVPDVGPPAVPATAAIVAAPDARRQARPDEADVVAWLETSTAPLARALKRQLRQQKGLTESQWVAAMRKVRS